MFSDDLPELDKANLVSVIATDKATINNFLTTAAHASETATEATQSVSPVSLIDYSPLIQIRRDHETLQARKGTRKRGLAEGIETETGNNENTPRKFMKAQMAKMFDDILQEDEQDRAIGTGAGRKLCWTAENPGYSKAPPTVVASGNTANAAEVASADAKKVELPINLSTF